MRAHKDVVAEVESLPDGPATGAFFDFDGTIIAGYSGLVFMKEQVRRREMSIRDIVKATQAMVEFGLGNSSFSAMMMVNAQFMRGSREDDYSELGRELFDREIRRQIYPESAALIRAHLRKGHTVAIVSSATEFQLKAAADYLNVEHVLCSQLATENGVFTGEVVRPTCFGDGKVIAAKKLAKKKGVDLAQSFFYSDSDDDLQLLEAVGNPRPLNPNKKLKAIAEERGWQTRTFTSRRRPKTGDWVRSIAATASMLTAVASSLPIKALTGSKREAQNFSSTIFAETASALIGLKLDVTGEEHLWSQRPAVFIFNHQSKADLIITAKLLRRDFSGVARRHGGKANLFDKAMEMGGVVLIDRADRGGAIKALEPLVRGLREENQSVAIAPEGTRSNSIQPGPFKKGAFHVAMQAGVPIVPIVIHNSIDVAPNGEFIYRSATVCVDILPPIDTSSWTRGSLDSRIAEVRNLYLKTLGLEETDAPA